MAFSKEESTNLLQYIKLGKRFFGYLKNFY